MPDAKSTTPWVRQVAAGEQPNAGVPEELCEELFQRLVGLARKKLQGRATGEGDETDVAVSAFRTFFRRAKECKFSELQDQNHLLNLLLWITANKAADLKNKPKKKKHGGGRVAGGDVLEKNEGVEKKPGYRTPRRSRQEKAPPLPGRVSETDPESDLTGFLNDECRRLLDLLSEEPDAATLRKIAVWKLEGYTTKEIQEMSGLTRRSIDMKVARIKKCWERERMS